MDALHDPPLLQLVLGHPADAVGGEVGVPGLDAPQAAQVLVALLLPLRDQVRVCNLLPDAVVVEVPGDRLAPVEQVEQVPGERGQSCLARRSSPRLLVVDFEDRPECLNLPLALVVLGLGLPHLALELLQRGLDQLPALRGRLLPSAHFGHPGSD